MLFTTRLITLTTGFILNLAIANIILRNMGVKEYAIFSFIASLPGLLNFLDLGMGTAAYNEIVDSKSEMSKYGRMNQTLSLIYLFSVFMTFLSLGLFFVAFQVAPDLFHVSLLSSHRSLGILQFAIVLICLAIPFSITYKILQATDRNLDVILLQGIIPVVTVLLVYLGIHLNVTIFVYLAFPIALFSISILAFLYLNHFLRVAIPRRITNERQKLYDLIKHSYLSLGFILITNLFVFLPRYVLAQRGSADAIVHFGFMMMFLISAQSLVSVDAQLRVTRIRRSSKLEQSKLIQIGTARSIVISAAISVFLIALSIVDKFLAIRVITLQEALFASALLIIWATQIVSASVNSQTKNIPFFISLNFATFLLSLLISKFCHVTTFTDVLLLLMIPCYLLISIVTLLKFRMRVNV